MAALVVDERTFQKEVLESELPVLIDVYADWCAPCKQTEPEVEAFARFMEGKVKVVKVNLDRSPVLARELRVQSVPAFFAVAQGRVVDAHVGVLRRAQLEAMFAPYVVRSEGAVSPTELAGFLQQQQAVPVDVREPVLYRRAHLPGAVNVPEGEVFQRLADLHMLRAAPVLYCRAGDRAKELSESLASQGVTVNYLEGGLLAWEASNLEIERPD